MRFVLRGIWLVLAIFFFVLGLVGLALPVIPQVPFFLLSIYFTSKFSPRFHNWISNNRLYKKYLLPLKNAIKSEKEVVKDKSKQVWYKVLMAKLGFIRQSKSPTLILWPIKVGLFCYSINLLIHHLMLLTLWDECKFDFLTLYMVTQLSSPMQLN